MKPDEFDILLERSIDGSLESPEEETLTAALRDHEWAQDRFVRRMALGAELRHRMMADEGGAAAIPEILPIPIDSRRYRLGGKVGLIAASIVFGLGVFAWFQSVGPPAIAELISSEGAAWEGDLPTAPGSQLTRGFLKLKSGIATIQFRSGVEVQLEAPAHLVLETPMRGRLLAGSAIIDVPESAIGFIIETHGSYAVDHGTHFSVLVDEVARTSEYEVLSGEISVHHEESGEVVRLTDEEVIMVHPGGVASKESLPGEEKGNLPVRTSALRLETDGREMTVIRGNDLKDRIHPDFLMAKRGTVIPEYDRESLFAFDLSRVNLSKISTARLRLNLVPCGLGFAARLPKTSTFSVYGMSGPWDESHRTWNTTFRKESGSHLGSFSIPRSQQTGSFVIESERLMEFLDSHAGEVVTFLLVRDTDEAMGNGLVHSFASSRHPEASGPTLTLW